MRKRGNTTNQQRPFTSSWHRPKEGKKKERVGQFQVPNSNDEEKEERGFTFSAALVTFPPLPSVFSTALMTASEKKKKGNKVRKFGVPSLREGREKITDLQQRQFDACHGLE